MIRLKNHQTVASSLKKGLALSHYCFE